MLFILFYFFVIIFYLESPLAVALKVPCNVFAASFPERFTTITEITSLSLTSSNLTALAEFLGLLLLSLTFPISLSSSSFPCLGSFTGLIELDLSHNPLGDSAVPLLVSMIKASHTLKTLR